jgi:hypothetical protein
MTDSRGRASRIVHYGNDPVALGMNEILLVAISATRLGIWVYATGRSHLLYDPIDARSRRAGVVIVIVPATAYIVAIAVAGPAPTASLVIYAVVPLLYFVGITLARSSAPSGAVEHDFT